MFPELNQSQNQAMPQQPQQSMETDPYNPMELEQPNINVPNISAVEAYKSYQPQMAMQNRFAQEAGNPPNRMDFKPTGMQRITAALAGFAGSGPTGMWGGVPVGFRANPNQFEDTQRILDQPYNEALVDYKSRIDPLRAAADDERMANTVQSNFLDRTVNRDIQERNFNRMSDRDRETARQGDIRLNQSNERNKILERQVAVGEWRNQHPAMKLIFDENGYVREWDPTGQKLSSFVTDEDGEPIKASQLPERERLRITIEGRDQNIQTAGAEARATKEIPTPAPAPRTTTTKQVVKDAAGNIVGSRDTQATTGAPGDTTNTPRNGNKILMYAPNGQAAWIKPEDTDQAQVDGFTFSDPRTGPDFRPPVQRRVPILGR